MVSRWWVRRRSGSGAWSTVNDGRGGHAAGDAPLGLPGRRTGLRPPVVSLSRPGGFLGRLPSRRRGRRAVPVHGLRHGQRPFSQPRVARTPLTSPGDPEGLLRRGIPFSGFLAVRAGLGGSPLLGSSDAAALDQCRRVCVWRSPGRQAPRLCVRVAPPHQFVGARAPRSSASSSSFLTAPRAPSIHIRGQIVQYRSPRGGPAPTAILAFGPRLTNGVRSHHRSLQLDPSGMGKPQGQLARHLQIAKSQ
ncbi:hypothetical protein NDU88_003484 [Pleurodeles waltl]|uniref:Uncharacterized protein n=1 Tax=Pleurodeles waltl TaxID=8319 RepID=A0AAV7RHJ3_PLEWA|nr:hypothetical protein NDU88_003484 [Pleurodeles waltl]